MDWCTTLHYNLLHSRQKTSKQQRSFLPTNDVLSDSQFSGRRKHNRTFIQPGPSERAPAAVAASFLRKEVVAALAESGARKEKPLRSPWWAPRPPIRPNRRRRRGRGGPSTTTESNDSRRQCVRGGRRVRVGTSYVE